MDYSDYTSIAQHHHHHHHHLRNRQDNRHPSFSSTLLDQIYKSIDDSSANSTIKTKKHHHQNQNQNQYRTGSLNDKTVANRYETGFLTDDFVRSRNQKITEPIFFKQHSTSSSSDSSGFSSSESDSFYKRSKSVPHPKPIRTTIDKSQPQQQPQQQHHGSFLRTKSKASKIYADLKKVKQPISPGGRLATFLNTIFTKKPAKINTRATTVESSSSITTCSSASSFSRSCLSKTPSSSEKSKRSVRFMDEECIQKDRESIRKAVEIRVMEENRRVIEAAKELLRTYQKSKDEDEEEDDEDDLFELDHLSVIGIEKFREELPVYETTRLNTHRIISR